LSGARKSEEQAEPSGQRDVEPLTEIFYVVAFIKTATAIFMVVVLSLLAEVVSPRFAGILSGIEEASALGKIKTKSEAVNLARRLAKKYLLPCSSGNNPL